MAKWTAAERLAIGAKDVELSPNSPAAHAGFYPGGFRNMTWSDDILTKVDRASMAASVKVRAPLLDPRGVEFATRVPLEMKIRDGNCKWLLRRLLGRYVPQNLVERPKKGFVVPIGNWLCGPLREWAEALLDELRLRLDRLLDYILIRQKWTEHLSGRRDWQRKIWDVLMFQAWRDSQWSILIDCE